MTQIFSTDNETLASQKRNYNRLFVENHLETPLAQPATIAASDELAHVEDTELFPVIRDGQRIYVTWNQITPDEHRNAYVNTFYPCDWEVVY
ncbi:MAG: hypothetical protein PVS3B3_31240 [Ktedonobacteraceae bacterium]